MMINVLKLPFVLWYIKVKGIFWDIKGETGMNYLSKLIMIILVIGFAAQCNATEQGQATARISGAGQPETKRRTAERAETETSYLENLERLRRARRGPTIEEISEESETASEEEGEPFASAQPRGARPRQRFMTEAQKEAEKQRIKRQAEERRAAVMAGLRSEEKRRLAALEQEKTVRQREIEKDAFISCIKD